MRADIGRRMAHLRRNHAPRWLRPILEVPLEVKLLGANLIIVGVALLLLFGPVHLQYARLTDAYIVVAALTLGATVNFVLVRFALGPIKAIERAATRIAQGMLGERVPTSMVADHQLARLSTTINAMLNSLAAGREHVQQLGMEVAHAESRERARVARELRDTVGTMLVTAHQHIAIAAAEGSGAGSSRLADARELLRTAIEALGSIARSPQPHLTPDLGVPGSFDTLVETSPNPRASVKDAARVAARS